MSCLRDDHRFKNGCFVGKVPRGGGGGDISDPKNYITDFVGFKTVIFGCKFWIKFSKKGEGGGGHFQSEKFSLQIFLNLQFLQKKAQ